MYRDIRGILVIRVHHNMTIALSTQNINIIAYNFDQNPIVLTPESIKSGLKLLPREFRNRTIIDGFQDIFNLSRSINAVKPDIIHVNALQDLVPAFLAVKICAINGHKPAIIAMSRSPLPWRNPRRAWINAKFIKYFSDGFTALATTHKNQLLRLGISADKVTVIPNPYDPLQLETSYFSGQEKSNKKFRIVYIANICKRKAQDVLINAAIDVLKKYPDVKFKLIGRVIPGEEEYAEKLNSLIKKYDIEESIHLVGQIPYEDVLASLQNSDIFVFPTHSEMMPRAVIEAMVIGVPIVASAVDGILDLIQHRKTGILVQPGNITDLASAICELIENPDLANTLGLAGQKFVKEYCSPERVGRQFCNFYQYILNRKYRSIIV